jgi:predicted RNA polymerase sigma factor
VCGDLLAKLGRFDKAHEEFERAASLTRNGRERALLLARAASCAEHVDHRTQREPDPDRHQHVE